MNNETVKIIASEENEQSLSKPKKKDYFQVDAMKALMIALVIMDHTFTHDFLHQYGSAFWERISIPILMIIMGFNMGKSFEGRDYTKLKEYYTYTYFESKLKRFMIPYLILYFIHGVMRLIVFYANISTNSPPFYDDVAYRYFGFTFFYGPGLWFIPVLFGTILVFPILHFYFKKNPVATLAGTFIVEILNQIIIVIILFMNNFAANETMVYFLYDVFCLFSAIGLGLWMSADHEITSKHNLIIWVLFPISVFYMIFYSLNLLPLPIPIGDYQLFFFPYSAMLFLIGMKFLPENPTGAFSNFVRKVSKATYHILLTQILYFSIWYQFFLVMTDGNNTTPDVFDAAPINYLWFYPLNLLVTFGIGLFWKELENRFYQKLPENKNLQVIYKIVIKIAFIAFIAWLAGNIVFLILYLPF